MITRTVDLLRDIVRHSSGAIGLSIVVVFLLIGLLAPVLAPYDPFATDFLSIRSLPDAAHWFGTDELGRDIFSRMLYGASTSLLAAFTSVAIAVVIGLPLGLVAGYFGGVADMVISRLTDAMLTIPFLILAIALAASLGPSLANAMLAIGISSTPYFVRIARAQAIVTVAEDYVEAARAIGLPHMPTLIRYILPNTLPPIIVQCSLMTANAILAEASLSFLGLGQQPPSPSWGTMLNSAKDFIVVAPWMSIFPGAAIFLVAIGFNLLGDGLRIALDPRS